MSTYLNRAFWLDTLERAIKTGAQVLVALIGTGTLGILQVDWLNAFSVTALAVIVSVLTSIASVGASDTITPASTVKISTAEGKHVGK
ncbi:holin [Alloscardovia omnicolens]|uniref:Holin n=1 Tax=Alloscardovia omnicolens TaxID=419015 RepID=A0A2I1M1N5_9BIFI|nr:holin [Alloscardovia omnicolens]PKZ14035.1 holin [Alloscardovia omnicolens]